MRCLRPVTGFRLISLLSCLPALAAPALAGASSVPVRSERQKLWAEEVREAIARRSPRAARTGPAVKAGAAPARGTRAASGPAGPGSGEGRAGGDPGAGSGKAAEGGRGPGDGGN